MNLPTILALGAIAAFFLFIIYVKLRSFAAGTITIDLPAVPARAGAQFQATITLQAKQALEIQNVRASLLCTDTETVPDSGVPIATIYRDTRELDAGMSLDKGQDRTWQASFTMPQRYADTAPRPDSADIPAQLLDEAHRRRQTHISWHVLVEVETTGPFLTSRQAVLPPA